MGIKKSCFDFRSQRVVAITLAASARRRSRHSLAVTVCGMDSVQMASDILLPHDPSSMNLRQVLLGGSVEI